jgi:hypothetical protein
MRVRVRTGPLLLALAAGLAGCSQSSDTSSVQGSKPGKSSTAATTSADQGAEYVLTIPGMS